MIETDLRHELAAAARRFYRLRLWSALAICWLALAIAAGYVLWWTREQAYAVPGFALAFLAAAALLAIVGCLLFARRAPHDDVWIARRIEARFPDLDARLLAALQQRRDNPQSPLGYLQATVIREAMIHARGHDWREVVSDRRLALVRVAHAGLLVAFLLTFSGLIRNTAPSSSQANWWLGGIAERGPHYEITVEPEDAELERGTSLLALARFKGPLPADVDLLYRVKEAEPQQLRMAKSLDDPLFAGRVASVESDLTYAVRYGDQQTRWYKITVFDYPDLVRADARLAFPEYTGQSEAIVEDTRSVTAVEGTRLTLICRLNKPVTEAVLSPRMAGRGVDEGVESIKLSADAAEPSVYTATWELKQSRRYRLHLKDIAGRANKQPPEFVINVTPNKPPELKLASPARDVQVSPLEELVIKAQVRDDFGLRRYGVSYSMAGQAPQEVVLGENAPGKQRQEAQHLVAFESLQAEPDQLLSYFFWAEDAAPGGEVRRTSGDMFFAEVRPFEEIFRQGEQPSESEQSQQQQQQANQNAQKAEKLAELQKQIINATWKIIRREISAKPSDKFAPDVNLVGQSQSDARAQAEALGEDLQDAKSKAFLESVLKHMDEALAQLAKAESGPAIDPLTPALAAEQAAYQALLKLRAREHSVVRSRQRGGGGGGGGGGRNQQQLNQLELANNQNRYEQQRTAPTSEQEAQQREDRQVLNRLRELAQRQEDLNKQVKELQTALEAARDEEQKDEIRRQLARLRDQQQQMLRDTDELRDRMDRPENQERMADSRQQLEQTRNNIRRASEALEQGMVSQAAAAGERAANELNNLRDDFRQQTAGQFTEAMNQMRDDARKLDETEQDLSQRLANLGRAQERPLRDTGERQKIAQGLREQKDDLQKLVEQMQRTVEEAETSEPLLAKQLYDAVRETHHQKPEQALEGTSQLLERGFVDEARLTENEARRGITKLREGVDKAAQSVLGDETEALRRARNALDALAEELNREIRRNLPAQAGEPNGPAENADRIARNTPRPGQPGSEEPQGEGQQPGQAGQSQSPGAARGQQPQEGATPQRRPGQNGEPGPRPGQQPGEQPQQPGGQQEARGQQQGGQQQGGQQPGGQQGGQQPGAQQQGGQQQGGQQQGGQQQGGQQPGGQQQGQPGGQRGGNPQRGEGDGDLRRLAGGATGPGGNRELSPIAGEGFREWSDRLRDVEEMVSDPQMRAEAARIRDRARSIRAEFKRHSEQPNWDLVQEFVGRPLMELREAVASELLKREGADARVPIDREPVPPRYSGEVRRYYERLGSGK